jgi:uncharacterized protein (AIM24 family)
MLLGGTGFFIDHFHALDREGIVWVHGYGNVFEVALGPGEAIDIEPVGWVYKDSTVQMETQFQKLTTGLFASAATWCGTASQVQGASASSRCTCTCRPRSRR